VALLTDNNAVLAQIASAVFTVICAILYWLPLSFTQDKFSLSYIAKVVPLVYIYIIERIQPWQKETSVYGKNDRLSRQLHCCRIS